MSGSDWLNDEDFYRDLALQAAYDNDLDTLRELLAKFPIENGDNEWLGYLMEDYICHLKPDGAQLLIDAGINLNYADYGFYPLHVAIDRGGKLACELVAVLLAGGADPNLHGFHDWTALHRAALTQPDNFPLLKILLDGGADPRISTRIDRYETPVEEARSSGHHKTAKFIEDTWVPPILARKPPKPR